MTEVLFILTTVFVAYVVYVIVNEPKPSVKKTVVAEAKTVEIEQPKPKTTIEPVASAAKVEKKVPPAAKVEKKAAAGSKPTASKGGLKDPKTGEIATSYSNYRFTKRWIKDALVAEGLLDKVYKNNELDAEVESKIKVAVASLEKLEKYKA
ncbi:MAG: hypothetical protein HOO92_10130 [Methylococcaceae bacterium]|nr:hypothetical protein [Methylococcaceae bacterium]